MMSEHVEYFEKLLWKARANLAAAVARNDSEAESGLLRKIEHLEAAIAALEKEIEKWN